MKKKFKYSILFYIIKYVLLYKISVIYIKYREKRLKSNKIIIKNNIQKISTKQSIQKQKISFLKKIFSRRITSGGTTGVPTKFYEYYWVYFLETFYINFIFNKGGWTPYKKTVVFRGDRIDGLYQVFGNMLIISSYKMLDNIDKINKIIKDFNPTWVYAYPSILYSFYKESVFFQNLPLEGFLFGSEKLLSSQKRELLENYKDIKIIEWYGMSEKAALAYRISPDNHFTFFKSYSKVFLIKEKENDVYAIYGSSYIQAPTKIINYQIGDYVRLDKNDQVIEIVGRKQDFIYLKEKKIPFSQAIGSIHGDVWDNIKNWQIIQNEENVIIFKLNIKDYSKYEKTIEDMNNNLQDLINKGLYIKYIISENIQEFRTIVGKSKYFVQNYKLNE